MAALLIVGALSGKAISDEDYKTKVNAFTEKLDKETKGFLNDKGEVKSDSTDKHGKADKAEKDFKGLVDTVETIEGTLKDLNKDKTKNKAAIKEKEGELQKAKEEVAKAAGFEMGTSAQCRAVPSMVVVTIAAIALYVN